MDRIEADWLTDAKTQKVFSVLGDHPTFAVGGCVRNSLMGIEIKDIDLATRAIPADVIRLSESAGLRVIPTGVDHGTVTVLVEDVPFEVTTFRRDVETDGRRAVVAFSDTIEEDARRRDFTMNAVYADANGALHDPVNGLPDIADRRVRFIENAVDRIREDYLRSLRFFRFSAWYGNPQTGMDADALDAIAQNIPGLETLSRERVGSELLRLLEAPDPVFVVAAMRTTGVLGAVLPGSDDTALGPLVHLESAHVLAPDPLRRLACLGGDVRGLRLSRSQLSRVEDVQAAGALAPHVAGYRYGYDIARDGVLLMAATMGQAVDLDALDAVQRGADAQFPIRAADLMPKLQGKALGDALKRLEERWIDSGFTLSRDALLSKG